MPRVHTVPSFMVVCMLDLACSLHQQCLTQQSCDGHSKAALPPGPSLASSQHHLRPNLGAHLSLLRYTGMFRTSQASCTKRGRASSSEEFGAAGDTALVSVPETETSQEHKAIDVSVGGCKLPNPINILTQVTIQLWVLHHC